MRKGHILFWTSIITEFALGVAAFAYAAGLWVEIGFNGLSLFMILVGGVASFMCGTMFAYWVEYKKTNAYIERVNEQVDATKSIYKKEE